VNRRKFLVGAGAAVALPFLESLAPRRASAQAAAPKRFLAFYVPNGIHMPAWTPSASGASWELTPILAALAPVKGQLNVITGLANRPAQPDGAGDHAGGTSGFLTARHALKTEGTDIRLGISVDQVIAGALAGRTPFPSLQLGSDGGGSTGNCDSGYACAYTRNISWAGPSTPLAKETSPQAVFDRLFAGRDPGESAESTRRRKQFRLSVLDAVREDARRLSPALGRTDRAKLDEYLTGVRELEQRVQAIDEAPACQGVRPATSSDFRARVQAMNDLMVTALACDLTRVITFMMGNAGSNRVHDFLGIRDGHHQLSHHENNPENHRQLQAIATWEVEQLAYLLGRMHAVREGERSLLENSLVFFSSEIEDGNAHRHVNLPVVLAGAAGGAFPTGRHVRLAREQPIANLFVTILQAMGLAETRFGDDGTGPLSLAG
jgi:hypothetical protein